MDAPRAAEGKGKAAPSHIGDLHSGGPSVEEVKKFVDSFVGRYSKNEYFEMAVHGL